MKGLRSCIVAFSMYSRLPMPRIKWDEGAMEYAFCFFPLVGGAVGLALALWWRLAAWLALSPALTAAVCVAIPLLVTGGIHMDGFCDTADALASNQSRERKLEILKDPRAGAFAIIACGGYLLVQFGVWCQGAEDGMDLLCLALVPVLSRSLSGLAAATRRNARGSGLLATFANAQSGRWVRVGLAVWLLGCGALLLWADPLPGAAALSAAGLAYLYYYLVSSRQFGGITGDLAGWFLQLCELACLLAMVLTGRVVAAL